MNFGSTDPLTSRTRFQWKSVVNIAALLGIFILLVPLLTGLAAHLFPGTMGKLVANGMAIALVSFLYTVWDKRPIRLRCPHCAKIILSNTPWKCGSCHKDNQNAKENSFVDKCGQCQDEPKTYQCHHCGDLIFLTEDEDKTSPARCLHAPVTAPPEDTRLVQQQKREEEKAAKDHAILMADLDEKYGAYQKRKELGKGKSPLETAQEEFATAHDKILAAEEVAREQKALVREKYKDDPDLLERELRFIDDWLRQKIP